MLLTSYGVLSREAAALAAVAQFRQRFAVPIERDHDEEATLSQAVVLAGLTRLKQLCSDPAHHLDDGSDLPGRSGKLSRGEELLAAPWRRASTR